MVNAVRESKCTGSSESNLYACIIHRALVDEKGYKNFSYFSM